MSKHKKISLCLKTDFFSSITNINFLFNLKEFGEVSGFKKTPAFYCRDPLY